MHDLVDGVMLTAEGEAERLWRRAEEAFIRAPGSIAQLCEAIELGVRVVEISLVNRLQPERARFPAPIARMLASPPPAIDVMRDFVNPARCVTFLDLVDMLSEEPLPCISHQLHAGAEDRGASCRSARRASREAVGFSLAHDARRPLMLIGAYRNRLFALPPPVRLVPSDVIGAFPSLAVLADRLFAAARAVPV
jgi:hypothetical protein